MRFTDLGDGWFLVREGSVDAFLQQHPTIRGAPLQACGNRILDKPSSRRGGVQVPAMVSVRPAAHISVRASGRRTMRRAGDTKTLTEAGREALGRRQRPSSGATQLWSRSVVWLMEFHCKGRTGQCDVTPPKWSGCVCAVHVTLRATVENVADKMVAVRISGQHNAAGTWDASKLSSARGADDSSTRKQLSDALCKVEELRVELATQEFSQAPGFARAAHADGGARADAALAAAPAAAPGEPAAPTRRDAEHIQAELTQQQAAAKRLKGECQNRYPRSVRDDILRIAKDGHAASATQMLLRKEYAAAPAGLAQQEVPPRDYIQGVIDGDKRIGRNGLGPYDNLAVRNREMATEEGGYRCISHQEQDPDAVDERGRPQHEREGVMWAAVYSSLPLLENAVGADVAEIDAKWRTCSDGHCTTAILAGKARWAPHPGEGPIPELSVGGWETHDMVPAVIIMSNHDNFHTPRIGFRALRRMLRCSDPDCTHPIVLKERPDGRGFWLERDCKGVQDPFSALTMIDKAAHEARSLRSMGQPYTLCGFHVPAAQLKWFEEKASIRGSSDLMSLLTGTKFIARSRSRAAVQERWRVVKAEVLPRIALSNDQIDRIVDYIEKEWLDGADGRWQDAWTDVGRLLLNPALILDFTHFL